MDTVPAFVIAVDVQGFSTKTIIQQIDIVDHLVTAFRSTELWAVRTAERLRYLNSTGDGFFAAVEARGDVSLCVEVSRVAQQMAAQEAEFANPPHGVRFRVGVHYGTVGIPEGSSFAVGSGLNWCARICDIADAGQVALSHEFATEVFDRLGVPTTWGSPWALYPPRGESPWEVRVKHGKRARFRLLARSPVVPRRLQEAEIIATHAETALSIVAAAIAAALTRGGRKGKGRTLKGGDCRLTLWEIDENRFVTWGKRVQLNGVAAPSTTPWLLRDADGPCQHPLARAVHEGRPVVLRSLPPARPLGPYVEAWASHGCDEHLVRKFGRPPRAMAVLPLQLLDTPVGVLCIDFADPVAVDDAVLDAVLDSVRVQSGYFLAALTHLR